MSSTSRRLRMCAIVPSSRLCDPGPGQYSQISTRVGGSLLGGMNQINEEALEVYRLVYGAHHPSSAMAMHNTCLLCATSLPHTRRSAS